MVRFSGVAADEAGTDIRQGHQLVTIDIGPEVCSSRVRYVALLLASVVEAVFVLVC